MLRLTVFTLFAARVGHSLDLTVTYDSKTLTHIHSEPILVPPDALAAYGANGTVGNRAAAIFSGDC